MKGGKAPLGYTIVEVMVVLAVSAFMLVISGSFINGKQRQASFDSGIKELSARIQDTTEEISNGQYSDIQLSCSSATPKVQVSSGTNKQGKNSDCIFLGKMLHFSLDGDSAKYEVVPIVGGRQNVDDTSKPSSTAEEAGLAAVPELAVAQTVPNSLEVYRIIVSNNTAAFYRNLNFGVLFLQDLGTLDAAGGSVSYNNGAQLSPRLHAIPAVTRTMSSSAASAIVSRDTLTYVNSVVLCVRGGDRFAQIRFANGGGAARASLDFEVINIRRTETAPCSS